MSKPLSRRQLEVLQAIRRLQATGNPLPDAAVEYWEIRAAVGDRGLLSTVAVLMGRGLLIEVEEASYERPDGCRQRRWTMRAVPPEDVA